MTIKEYFEREQPISAKTIGDTGLYQDIKTITFEVQENTYASIKIAHIGEDLWSFGYEIKRNAYWPIICKDCTTHSTVMGCISNLIFGMIQVLLYQLKGTAHTETLKAAIYDGAEEAMKYYKRGMRTTKKITI